MDKAQERARAWHRFRTRTNGPYVPPALEGTFAAGFEAGWKLGRDALRDWQLNLPTIQEETPLTIHDLLIEVADAVEHDS